MATREEHTFLAAAFSTTVKVQCNSLHRDCGRGSSSIAEGALPYDVVHLGGGGLLCYPRSSFFFPASRYLGPPLQKGTFRSDTGTNPSPANSDATRRHSGRYTQTTYGGKLPPRSHRRFVYLENWAPHRPEKQRGKRERTGAARAYRITDIHLQNHDNDDIANRRRGTKPTFQLLFPQVKKRKQ